MMYWGGRTSTGWGMEPGGLTSLWARAFGNLGGSTRSWLGTMGRATRKRKQKKKAKEGEV